MKRFYEAVTVAAPSAAVGYRILLDGRPVRTPARAPLGLPTEALARAIAAEWAGQGDEVDLETMDLTRVAAAAVDRVMPRRAELIAEIAGISASDLVCYRADQPAALIVLQTEQWQPLVDWAVQAFDAPLAVTTGIMPVVQPAMALEAMTRAVAALGDYQLAGVSLAASVAHSLVIALALVHGRLDGPAAAVAATLDDVFQADHWGEEAEATVRRQAVADDLELAHRYFGLLAGGSV